MTFLVTMPTIHPPYRDECIATMGQQMRDNLLVVENSERNRGLAGSWNIGARRVLYEGLDWLITISAGMRFGDSGGDDFFAVLDDNPDAWIVEGGWDIHKRSDLFSGWHYIAWSRRNVLERIGLLDENFWPIYCVVPETRVLTTDLRWVRIGDVEVGAQLVGFDEHSTRKQQRCYRPTTVTSSKRRFTECVRITMEDGREVTCSLDHRWLSKAPRPNNTPYGWREAKGLRPGYRIITPLTPWSTATSFEEGWLSGIIDGEGSLHRSNRMRGLTIAQAEGEIFDRVKALLSALDIPFTWRIDEKTVNKNMGRVEINARRHVLQLLGRLRPYRMIPALQDMWDGMHIRSPKYPNDLAIEQIEPAGLREVVSLETTTRTFLAEGMGAHNCEDADWSVRLLLALEEEPSHGVNRWIKPDVDAWLVMAQHSGELAGIRNDYPHADAYFKSKWGRSFGDGLIPTYTRPFDDPTLPLSFWPTPPDPRAREHDGWALY